MNTYTAAAWQWQPTYNYYNPNELYHHGIMGMRWGKRNGPPYPLAPSAHSSEEKRLKSQNEGKLESWKAKETAKVNKAYDKKIAKVQAKLDRYEEKGKTKKADKARHMLSRIKAEKIVEHSAINQMKLEDMKAEKIALGKNIAKGVLGYAVATAAKVSARNLATTALTLGNVPLGLVAKGIWLAGDTYQAVKAVEAIRGAVTGRRRTKLKERQNFINKKTERKTDEPKSRKEIERERLRAKTEKAMDDYQKARAKSGSSDSPYMEKVHEEARSGRISDNTLTKAMKNDDAYRKHGKMLALQEISYRRTEGIKGNIVSLAKSMRSQGKTYAEIADRFGIDDHAAWSLVNDDL